jgi:hypothetical protein
MYNVSDMGIVFPAQQPTDKDNLEGPYSKLQSLFTQAAQQLSNRCCFLDLSKIPVSIDRTARKEFKKILPIFIEEQKGNSSILLKITNQYPELLKYVLGCGFKFKEANAEFSLLNYQYNKTKNLDSEEHPHSQSGIYQPKNQMTTDIVIKGGTDNPKVPQAPRIDTSFLLKETPLEKQNKFYAEICTLNPHRTDSDLFTNKSWNIDHYDQENYPIVLGTICDQKTFSLRRNELGLRFLDMPIHMPDQGWKIPPELEQFKEVIARAVGFEKRVNYDFEKTCYVYITVDQGDVAPHQAQRRTGWHGDSYLKINNKQTPVDLTCDHVYVIADNCPTPFLPGPFSLKEIDPENINAVLNHFAKLAEGKHPVYFPNYTLLRLDPYCVHNVGFNDSENNIFRTFVKISISQNKYCKLGNAHNPLFIYDWPMVPRYQVPYDRAALKYSSHRKDRDQFMEINPHVIDFAKDTCQLPWVKPEIQTAIRTKSVFAELAKEGELLKTYHDGFLVTIYSSEKGDWKVKASHGEEYFLNEKSLHKFYTQDPYMPGKFIPKPVLRRFIQLEENVRFMASWGSLQYAQKGNILMYIDKTDIYAISQESFKEDFTILG